ncbi:hypothetical protein [Flammeovirga aprica]|uniref:Uncharacterized protein n=1 Tax=Flammeovirga aprica JL-4 TaxID=694437 RepID=A0A7X9S248_9BACT|nr:hypothetical protein [Flammeovirga aprica]NME72909.1 hypothetical protein [Flammeovirga aprica JL-4]
MNLFFYTLYGELINFIREQNIPLIDPSNFELTGIDYLLLPETGGKSALEAAKLAKKQIINVLESFGANTATRIIEGKEIRIWYMDKEGKIKELLLSTKR